MKKNIELSEAIKIIYQNSEKTQKIESIEIKDALFRIIAHDILAEIDNPPFDRSPVDGYAVIAEDIEGASKENPICLKVIGKINAGDTSDFTLHNDHAIRIMTGAMIPKGANAVVKQEYTDNEQDIVKIYGSIKPFENYCYCGEDFERGAKLISKGEKITAIHLGILASIGIARVKVFAKPKVGLLVTGNELIKPGTPLTKGKIYNSNTYLLAARFKELSIDVNYIQQCDDDVEKVTDCMKKAVAVSDVVITTGGVSVGEKDIFHDVLPQLGVERKFWRVNIKPGTPVMFSMFNEVPIINLSGNPFAALATFELFVRPLIGKISRDHSIITREKTAIIDSEYLKNSKVKRFLRAYYEDGRVKFLKGGHSSGMIASLKNCNCLIEIPAGTRHVHIGDQVKVILL